MNLHLDETQFSNLIRITANQLNIPANYIEKDYWVTYALYLVFNHNIGEDTIFKGGTALAKCYKMIERFSEDIDLVVIRKDGETDNKLKTKIKTISSVVSKVLPEIELKEVTRKMGMIRKTAHAYPKIFAGNYGQVRDSLILESTWLGYYEPFTTKTVISFVGEMMLKTNQEQIANNYGLMPFEVQVLKPERTICEKIMSLVRFSYSDEAIDDLKKKIRHTYDLHQLLKQDEFLAFLNSPEFDVMLLKVANDDLVSFRSNNQWLSNHPNEACIFKDLDNIWKELSSAFNGDFSNLVYGDLPKDEDILSILKIIKKRLSSIKWTIE